MMRFLRTLATIAVCSLLLAACGGRDFSDLDSFMAEKRARLAQATVDSDAADRLAAKGYTAESTAMAQRAALEAAEFNVRKVELDIERLTIKAPFDGVLESDTAELGQSASVAERLFLIGVTLHDGRELLEDRIGAGRRHTEAAHQRVDGILDLLREAPELDLKPGLDHGDRGLMGWGDCQRPRYSTSTLYETVSF